MDAINASSMLAETGGTDTVNTPTWALLMIVVGVLVSIAFSVTGWLNSRAEKSDEQVAALVRENAKLREEAVLSEVKAIRTEITSTLASIKDSMARHDDEIADVRREQRAMNEWKVVVDAAIRKGGLLGS